jgi:spore coat polysaccharide biosynthesis protein SpsF
VLFTLGTEGFPYLSTPGTVLNIIEMFAFLLEIFCHIIYMIQSHIIVAGSNLRCAVKFRQMRQNRMCVAASIQARLGSTRLPGKVLFPLGDRRILKWSIDRSEDADTVDETVAAIGDGPENDAIESYCDRSNINYLAGPEDDLLERHLRVVEETGCDLLVRITADCPFVPSDEIDRVVEEHLSNDARYTTNVTENMPIGIGVDVVDPSLLRELNSLGETHPVKLARAEPTDWGTVRSDDRSWNPVSNVHLAVDTPTDYWSIVDALEAVGDDSRAVAEWLASR